MGYHSRQLSLRPPKAKARPWWIEMIMELAWLGSAVPSLQGSQNADVRHAVAFFLLQRWLHLGLTMHLPQDRYSLRVFGLTFVFTPRDGYFEGIGQATTLRITKCVQLMA